MTLDHILATFAAAPPSARAALAVAALLMAALLLGTLPGLRRALWRAALRPGARRPPREIDWTALARA